MCGIVGGNGAFNQNWLAHATSLLSHRGPDGAGTFCSEDKKIFLGHTRLSILDLSNNAAQPMSNEDGSIQLVFNGEIYNYLELKENLEELGYSFKTTSDTEVVLYSYMENGFSCVERFNGIFAFAIWDQSNNYVFLSRDRFGVKPLYYSTSKQGVCFSSEIKGILALNERFEINANTVRSYLHFVWAPGVDTAFEGIKKLPPGGAMLLENCKIKKKWVWSNVFYNIKQNKAMDVSFAIAKTRSLLGKAVERQTLSDVPVGAFLSGGVDSSAVVAFAKNHVPNLQCFTIDQNYGENDGFEDDLPHAINVANAFHLPLDILEITADTFIDDLPKMIRIMEEPIGDPAALSTYYICDKAKQAGISVLLSGVGGDDIFSGYRRHQALQLDRIFKTYPFSIINKHLFGLLKFSEQSAFGRRFNRYFKNFSMSQDERLCGFFDHSEQGIVSNLFSKDCNDNKLNGTFNETFFDFFHDLNTSEPELNKLLALEQRFFLSDHNLNYADKMSMATGVELRVPFLDNDLVDFVATVPVNVKTRWLNTKWLLKKSLAQTIPSFVIKRNKTGFGLPLRNWLRNELREFTRDQLHSKHLYESKILNRSAVLELLDINENGEFDHTQTIFTLLCISIWVETFKDNLMK